MRELVSLAATEMQEYMVRLYTPAVVMSWASLATSTNVYHTLPLHVTWRDDSVFGSMLTGSVDQQIPDCHNEHENRFGIWPLLTRQVVHGHGIGIWLILGSECQDVVLVGINSRRPIESSTH